MSRYTSHESHTLRTVEGELRCVLCHASPDWPLIETACDQGGLRSSQRRALLSGRKTRVDDGRPQMRASEIEHAIALRAGGKTWDEIAAEMERHPNAIRKAIRAWNAGTSRAAQKRSA